VRIGARARREQIGSIVFAPELPVREEQGPRMLEEVGARIGVAIHRARINPRRHQVRFAVAAAREERDRRAW